MSKTRAASRSSSFLVIVFAVAAVAVAAAAYGFYRREAAAIRRVKYDELKSIADLKTVSIVRCRQERVADALLNSRAPVIQSAISRWLENPEDAVLKDAFLTHLQLVRDLMGYQNAILAGADGRLLLTFDPRLTELDASAKQLVTRAVSSREAVFGDFFRCPHCNQVHLDVAAPMVGANDAPVAVLLLRSDPEDFLYPLIQSWPMPSRTAETLLVRKDGEDALFLNTLRHRSDPALTLRVPLSRTDLPGVQAVLGKTGKYEGKDYRDVKVLADLRPVPGSPWFIVAKVDAEEIFAEVRNRGVFMLAIVVLAVLLVALTAVFAISYRRARLYRRLFRAERERREAQEEIRATLYSIDDGVIAMDASGRVTRINPAAERLTAWREAEALGKPLEQVFRIVSEETRAEVENPVQRVLREGEVVGLANHSLLIAKDGTEHPIADSGAPIRDEEGNIVGVVVVFRDQRQERAAQKALRESEAEKKAILDGIQANVAFLTPELDVIWANKAAQQGAGKTLEDMVGRKCYQVFVDREDVCPNCPTAECARTRKPAQTIMQGTSGKVWDERAEPVFDASGKLVGVVDIASNITDRVRAEKEREKLEAQLRQAQKMEAVGRLAGGVAHDFNNMLTVIMGYTESALAQITPEDPLYKDLGEVLSAGRRSADLVRQLLAFSRKQIIQPTVMDLNAQLERMKRLLQRTIGEDIDLEFVLSPEPWLVKMDPGQVDQIIANLVVNARDAMPDGGKLTVETDTVTLDEAYCRSHAGFVPGEYVLLAVSDTGCGMDKETLEHIFEPFFTTKEMGKGTGLGLATVYGAVKQNNGFINVYSEPNQGTTFKIYLPRYLGAMETAPADVAQPSAPTGQETILLVEDDGMLRALAIKMLERQGYTVLEAAGAREALALCETHPGDIHLLLTDVVMPGISGKELADRLCARRPSMKVLYMSGYTANAIAHRGVLDNGTNFIGKPFSVAAIGKKVRQVLEQAP